MDEYELYSEKPGIENSVLVRHIMPSHSDTIRRLAEK